jgi:hypothetical protein
MDRPPAYQPACPIVWNTDVDIVTLHTATPAPADGGLNLGAKVTDIS